MVEEVKYAKVSTEKSLFELRNGEEGEWALEIRTGPMVEVLDVGRIIRSGRTWLWDTELSGLSTGPPGSGSGPPPDVSW